MKSLSRRSLLRVSGASGVAALVAANPLTPSYGAWTPVRAWLDSAVVAPGDLLVLNVEESLRRECTVAVEDATGLVWAQLSIATGSQVWVASAVLPGEGSLTVVTTRDDGKVFRTVLGYQVTGVLAGGARPTGTRIGMSSPDSVWDERVAEVGAGLASRRIFADLAAGAGSQLRLVEDAHAAGMLPVISYKVGGDVAGAASGAFDRVAEQAAASLASFGLPTAVSVWHEPYGDMSGDQYAAISRRLLPVFRRDELRVGPILNGWLLDNQVDTFASYCPDESFALWDWFGIDAYESGTPDSPGGRTPADRIRAVSTYLGSRGIDLPLGVGEYNGFSAETIADAGEALLSTPDVWFGCLWNSTGGQGWALSGDRLAAFRATLADARSADPVLP